MYTKKRKPGPCCTYNTLYETILTMYYTQTSMLSPAVRKDKKIPGPVPSVGPAVTRQIKVR